MDPPLPKPPKIEKTVTFPKLFPEESELYKRDCLHSAKLKIALSRMGAVKPCHYDNEDTNNKLDGIIKGTRFLFIDHTPGDPRKQKCVESIAKELGAFLASMPTFTMPTEMLKRVKTLYWIYAQCQISGASVVNDKYDYRIPLSRLMLWVINPEGRARGEWVCGEPLEAAKEYLKLIKYQVKLPLVLTEQRLLLFMEKVRVYLTVTNPAEPIKVVLDVRSEIISNAEMAEYLNRRREIDANLNLLGPKDDFLKVVSMMYFEIVDAQLENNKTNLTKETHAILSTAMLMLSAILASKLEG